VGTTVNFGAGKKDVFLLKYNSLGVLQWNITWGGDNDDIGEAIIVDSSDNIFLGGCTVSFGTKGKDMLLLKYDSFGVLQWNETWGGNYLDLCYAMTLDSSGNIYFAGQTNSFGSGGDDMILVKVSQDFDDTPATTIPGYDSLFMICLICTVSAFLIKKRRKSLK